MILAFDMAQATELLGIGGIAGLVGGMLGVGGGLVMIPAMVIVLGERFGPGSLHVYKLAAITASIIVSIPAVVRHGRAKAIVYAMLPSILPWAVVGVALGALAAKHFFSAEQTHVLRRIFGVCLELVVAVNVYQSWRDAHGRESLRNYCPLPRRRTLIGTSVGLPTGLIAGLLGIGGGVWNVPVQHLLFGMRLRYAIATSSYVVVFVSAAASIAQSFTVGNMPGLHAADGWRLALGLAPGALLGGWCGACLTHRLPVGWLRHAFHALLAVTGVRLIVS
jgi:uncharacterized membrane protein YfcA